MLKVKIENRKQKLKDIRQSSNFRILTLDIRLNLR